MKTTAASLAAALLTLFVVTAIPAAAQPLLERTANMEGSWTPAPHDLFFQFSHRFEIAGEETGVGDLFDDGKVVNYPSFGLAYGLHPRVSIGARYSSNSLIAGRVNEWQPYAKVVPLRAAAGRISASVTGAWNAANESLDGEVGLEADAGPVTLLGAVRGFSSPLDRPAADDEAEWALAAGARVALSRHLALSADYANMVSEPTAQVGWSAGVAARIPYTPHTLGFYATNVSSSTLEGVSVGLDDAVFWGFEFTVPLSGHRWGRIFEPEETAPAAPPAAAPPPAAPATEGTPATPAAPATEGAPATSAVIEVVVKELKFQASEIRVPVGATVRWINQDPLVHTSTAVDGTWDSGPIESGAAFERTFTAPGRFEYLCTPHPFMTGVVIVEGGAR